MYPNLDPPEITEVDIEKEFWNEVEMAETDFEREREDIRIQI